MPKEKVLIVQNSPHEGPGLIADLLKIFETPYTILNLESSLTFPSLNDLALLIILGGPDSVQDHTPKIQKELRYVKSAFSAKIPILGICLGLQLMVKANGGQVRANPTTEVGFRMEGKWNKIHLTSEGRKDPIFRGIPSEFKVFHLHGETVEITETMSILGRGNYCQNQIVQIGHNNYGFQFHLELTEQMLREWLKLAPELRNSNAEELLKDYVQIQNDYTETGKKIFTNYLKLIGLI